ncbi:MAG: c-type cytochrome biogenesis protein CcsB [Candidatus Eisenbacteria sp.]|nr:c-type cytochrome biogenesis protein CcsB [Candidatus Eisenbacteria bacterium]
MLYMVATAVYLARLFSGRERWGRAGCWILAAGLGLHTVGILLRWVEKCRLVEADRPAGWLGQITFVMENAPLANLYESMVFFSWSIVLVFLLLDRKYGLDMLGAAVSPLAAVVVALVSVLPGVSGEIEPHIPALQSYWLTIHVVTCFLAYAAFAISFVTSIIYLSSGADRKAEQGKMSKTTLEEINYNTATVGFLMLTIGIVTGAVWANYAWGSYWSWDNKETWSLITWFIYAALLHARLVASLKGKWMAILSIVGFGAVLFTFFGVNYLLPGLHSYL